MIFSKNRAEPSKKDLERILTFTEPDNNVRNTVLDLYDSLTDIKKKYFNHLNPLTNKRKDGMIIYTNHKKNSKLKINGWKSKPIDTNYSVHDKKGKQKIEDLLYKNGAVEVDAKTGNVKSYHRQIQVDPAKIAMKYGLIGEGEELSSELIGFDEQIRKKKAKKSYEGIGTRHHTAIAATGVDPHLYVLVLSRDTGVITIMKNYAILFSAIPTEIHPAYNIYLSKKYSDETPVLLRKDNNPILEELFSPKIFKGINYFP